MSTVGENIKRIRISKKLTQKQLGELCRPKMADSAIRRYENGNALPKIETIQRIAAALNVRLSDLVSTDWFIEKIEDGRIVREYSAVEIAIKDNLDKMNSAAKKKVFDYTEDLLENPKNLRDK